MGSRTVIAVSAVALLAAGGGAAASLTTGTGPRPPLPMAGGGPAAPARLVAYTGCDQFLSDVKARALQEVGPYGLIEYPGAYRYGAVYAGGVDNVSAQSNASAGVGASASLAAPSASGSGTAAPAYSSTNDQEAGADEPDTVKTNGDILAVLSQNPAGLQVAQVGGLVPKMVGSLSLPQIGYPTGMFLTGSDAIVLSQPYTARASGPNTEATVVSLADPAHPAVVRSFSMNGGEAGARLIAGRVVLVLQSTPNLPFAGPQGSTQAAQDAATQYNRSVIEDSTLSDWLPTVTASPSGRAAQANCAATYHTQSDSGLGTVSVVTLDPNSDQPSPAVSIEGSATTVYASAQALYVATSLGPGISSSPVPLPAAGGVAAPYDPAGDVTTEIHAFDLSDPTGVRYLGSGSVAGQLIGQYALSEYHGNLRVATTVGQATPAPGEGSTPTVQSDSRITVLAPQNGALSPVGSVTGLGAGEKIYAVRFEGPLAYVVTFRQTDPLYIVDLTDPAHPVLKGQLALTGYSSFLQPLSGSLILGVGEAVDSNLRQAGLQLSVFDVANPQAPALDSRTNLGQAYSTAQNDPHALLWWPQRSLVAMPLDDYGSGSGFAGVAVWQLGARGSLSQVARLSQPSPEPPAAGHPGGAAFAGPAVYAGSDQREVVVGPDLYTVSDSGIMATDMTNWTQAAWLPFT